MPRRHRSGRERAAPQVPRPPAGMAPAWAQVEGFRVQQVTNDRSYRCPGCDQPIRPGTPHLVVVPSDALELRRHWHTPCWQRELRMAR